MTLGRVVVVFLLLAVLVPHNTQPTLLAQGDDTPPPDTTPPPDPDAAAALVAALPSLATYERYILEEQQFLTFAERIDTPGGDTLSNTYTVQISRRDEVRAGENPLLRRVIERVTLRDGVETGRLTGELRLIAGTLYFNVVATGPAADPDLATNGWQVASLEPAAGQPLGLPLREDYAAFFNLPSISALHAGELALTGTIGTRPAELLRSVDDVLSRAEELRVQPGRFVDGGDVMFYRLLGAGLADVVAHTQPLPIDDDATRQAVQDGIRDVTFAVVVDNGGRVRSQIAAYNLVLRGQDATLFTAETGVYALQASVNIVAQYVELNPTLDIRPPNLSAGNGS